MPLETVSLLGAAAAAAQAGVNGNGEPHDGSKSFTPTAAELNAIAEKFSDPKFVELFQEYMHSLNDPETRAEEEMYLRQLEEEHAKQEEKKRNGDGEETNKRSAAREDGRIEVGLNDLNKFQFIFPRPGFAVEIVDSATSGSKPRKTFINICSSDRIDPFREESAKGKGGASQWFVPVSVSRVREIPYEEESASDGKETTAATAAVGATSAPSTTAMVRVFDAVLHPKSLQLADESLLFLNMVMDIIRENIEVGYGIPLVAASAGNKNTPSSTFEGTWFQRLPRRIVSIGTPQNQTVPRANAEIDGHKAANETKGKPTQTGKKPTTRSSATTTTPVAPSSPPSSEQAPPNPTPTPPPYAITHRGHARILDTWEGWQHLNRQQLGESEVQRGQGEQANPAGSPSGSGSNTSYPEELGVTLFFSAEKKCPEVWQVGSAAELHVRVIPSSLTLSTSSSCGSKEIEVRRLDLSGNTQIEEDEVEVALARAVIVLPYPVDEDPLSAKFVKSKKELQLVWKVVQPRIESKRCAAIRSPKSTDATTIPSEMAAMPIDTNCGSQVESQDSPTEEKGREGTDEAPSSTCPFVIEEKATESIRDDATVASVPLDGEPGDRPHVPVEECATGEDTSTPQASTDEPSPVASGGFPGHFSHLSDGSRVQEMLRKLELARKERLELERKAAEVEAETQAHSTTDATRGAEQHDEEEEVREVVDAIETEEMQHSEGDAAQRVEPRTQAHADPAQDTISASNSKNGAEDDNHADSDKAAQEEEEKSKAATEKRLLEMARMAAELERQRLLVETQREEERHAARLQQRKNAFKLTSRHVLEID